jgi:hypothetical protein
MKPQHPLDIQRNQGTRLLYLPLLFLTIIYLPSSVAICLGQQQDSCKVIQVVAVDAPERVLLDEYYHPNGIILIQNGIYQIKPAGKKMNYYRIVTVWSDSVALAWTVDSTVTHRIPIEDIEKIILPHLNDGVAGFPHPTMNKEKYQFSMGCIENFRNKKDKVCFDSECSESVSAFRYMTAGYGWKPVYRYKDCVEMIDVSVIHRIKGNKLYPPCKK